MSRRAVLRFSLAMMLALLGVSQLSAQVADAPKPAKPFNALSGLTRPAIPKFNGSRP